MAATAVVAGAVAVIIVPADNPRRVPNHQEQPVQSGDLCKSGGTVDTVSLVPKNNGADREGELRRRRRRRWKDSEDESIPAIATVPGHDL